MTKLEERLTNRVVRVWLSVDGKSSVRELFEGKAVFSAHVEAVHDLGLWLRVASKQTSGASRLDAAALLKWSYIAALQVPIESAPEPSKTPAERLQ